MDRHRLDQLAVLLAATQSRRQALRTVAAGFISVVVIARGARPVAAELCKERVPKPGYTPTVNGCGPSGFGWTVPDTYGDASFTQTCNRHDRCYGTCNESRLKCDYLMKKGFQRACKQAYRGDDNRKKRRKCLRRANLYAKVVSENGQSAYEAAQEEACECCGPGGDACGTRCCVEGSVCIDRARSRCCAEEGVCGDSCCHPEFGETCCGSTCCFTDRCWECAGANTCRYKCTANQFCDRNGVCEDCGPDGCGN